MPAQAIVIPLVVFALVAFLLALLLRRVGAAAGDLREDFEFRRGLANIARRMDLALLDLLPAVDEVRRARSEGDGLVPLLRSATEQLDASIEEVSLLPAAAPYVAARRSLVEDFERAQRAISLIEHGCTMQTGGDPRGEAQTAIKRGYLNLLHARESIRAHATERPIVSPSGLAALWRRRAN